MTPSRLRLVIGDDHHLLAEALRAALAKKHEVCAVAYTAATILTTVTTHRPDVLLLDLSLPERNGLELLSDLRAAAPATRIIIVTMHVDRVLAETTLNAGAMGFVPKDAGLAELDRAIAAVMDGETFISTRVPNSTNRVSLRAAHAALALLTPRQQEIVRMIADGLTSVEIAKQLGLSISTVAFHRTNIRSKLGVDSASDLLRYALLTQVDYHPVALSRRGRTRG